MKTHYKDNRYKWVLHCESEGEQGKNGMEEKTVISKFGHSRERKEAWLWQQQK